MELSQQLIFASSVAGAVGAAAWGVARLFGGDRDAKIRDRLTDHTRSASERAEQRQRTQSLIQRIGQAAAEPFMPKERTKLSGLRKQLAQAGIYAPAAVRVVTGFKLICLVIGVLLGWLVGVLSEQVLLGFSVGGLLGYLAPVIWLKNSIKHNQKELTIALPDALDLMVVCVEAGLTVDGAIQRVGEELVIAHPALSRELGLYQMQTQIGVSRADALKNLGERTNNPAIQSFAAMLIQAERFGTSIAQALRIQAETLRIQRQMAAEEMAAKASVKMSFPLVLCIFPATFIVLVGPAAITMFNSVLFE